MNSFPRTRKEKLKEEIDKLGPNEHQQIFNMIKPSDSTKVQNGVLISTDVLDDTCLTEIEKYVSFCLVQKERMDKDMKTRNAYERMIN
jgi:hypothetical protein